MGKCNIVMTHGTGLTGRSLTATPQVASRLVSGIRGITSAVHNEGFATTIFDVTDYGATTSRTDNGPYIKAAYDAAFTHSRNGAHSTVFFPPGTYNLTAAGRWNLRPIRTNDWYGQTSPTVACAGTVRFSGYGATIRYANASDRYSWLQFGGYDSATQIYTTFGNLEVEGFTIDPNWRQTAGQVGNVIYLAGQANLTNITIRDVTVPAHMVYRTTPTTSTTQKGIFLVGKQYSREQEHYGYCTGINVTGCNIYAQGKGICVISEGMGIDTTYEGPVKYLFDDINIDDCWVSGTRSEGSCIHLGSFGAGYRCRVTNTHIEDSTDNGLEIDAFNEAYVENLTMTKLRAPIGVTRFSWPYKDTVPNYVFKNLYWYGECTNAWWPDNIPEPEIANPEIEVVELRTGPMTSRRFGNFTFENCSCEVLDSYTHLNHWFFLHAPMDSVTISDCDMTIAGSDSYDPVYIEQRPNANLTLPISIHDMRWRNSTSNSYAALTSSQVTLVGSRSVTSDISGLS